MDALLQVLEAELKVYTLEKNAEELKQRVNALEAELTEKAAALVKAEVTLAEDRDRISALETRLDKMHIDISKYVAKTNGRLAHVEDGDLVKKSLARCLFETC
jgi:chromosome segregation ATPase